MRPAHQRPQPRTADAVAASPARRLTIDDAPTSRELVGRALAGDTWAEEAIYSRHIDGIVGLLTRLLGRSAEVDDAAQDTFARALERLGDLRDRDALQSWLTSIAVNEARRRLGRRRWMRVLGLDRSIDDVPLDRLARDDVPPEVRQELSSLFAVVQTLGAVERVAWSLKRIEGWGLGEIAQACACSLATVKRRIAAADRRIQRQLAPRDGGGGHTQLAVRRDDRGPRR